MKTATVPLAVALVAIVVVSAKPASADHMLDLSVGNPNIMPVEIRGMIGDPNQRNLDIMIGDPGLAPPVVSLMPTEGLDIVVLPPGPCHVLPPGPCAR